MVLVVAAAIVRRGGENGSEPVRAPLPRTPARLDERFTVPRDTIPIAWHPWSSALFARAQRERTPVVALLDAAWCESCQLYAATLASSRAARAALENDVLAVRVDVDRRPDVHARYHVTFDTLPTLIFLDPDGGVWDLTDAQQPSELVDAIAELRRSRQPRADPELEWLSQAAATRRHAPTPRAGRVPAAEADSLVTEIVGSLVDAWPHAEEVLELDTPLLEWDVMRFLRRHVERRASPLSRRLFLQGLRQVVAAPLFRDGSILREVEGAEDRVARARFLETNATLLDHFRLAAEWSGEDLYAEAARRVERFLIDTLFNADAGLFCDAQGTIVLDENGWPLLRGSEHARMGEHLRSEGLEPHVVPVFTIPGNARALVALREKELVEPALARLWEQVERRGYVPHDLTLDAAGVLQASRFEFLQDVVELGDAILALRPHLTQSDLWLARCRTLADALLARFRSPEEVLLLDAPYAERPRTPARMRVPLTPITVNARAVEFLLQLGAETGEERYRAAALQLLRACVLALESASVWEATEVGSAILCGRATQ
ncbi:MAG: thioredoxin family protein [Candidatus Latescibacterota bacterium]|nr:MAG: thioredoxin family protein [Candidatus Latescibacterota bacterium]